jgi:hypothetical protein
MVMVEVIRKPRTLKSKDHQPMLTTRPNIQVQLLLPMAKVRAVLPKLVLGQRTQVKPVPTPEDQEARRPKRQVAALLEEKLGVVAVSQLLRGPAAA